MRDYKDMADAVFRRRDEYAVALKRKKRIALSTCLSICALSLAVIGAIGIWKMGVVEPDPTVIGTKPQSLTNPTDLSEGVSSDTALSNSGASTPSSGVHPSKPVSSSAAPTDAAEETTGSSATNTEPSTDNVTIPNNDDKSTKPNKPTQATKPTTAPEVIVPTDTPLQTDPVESPTDNATEAPDYAVPDGAPEVVVPDETWYPATDAPSAWEPTPTIAAPCITDATEACPPDVECPADEADTPQTSITRITATGKVVDQNGKAVEGARVGLYISSRSICVGSSVTDSNGTFTITEKITNNTEFFLRVISVPDGYSNSFTEYPVSSLDGSYQYFTLTCTKR